MSIYLGIDPGGSGAIAAIGDGIQPMWQKNDATEREISEWLRGFPTNLCFALIEKVHAMPKQGVSSSFKFGMSYGFLRGLLIAWAIPFEEVSPQRWQGALGCRSGGDKNVTKAKAQQLWPDVKFTHANSDALLIAEYLRRAKCGELSKTA
jgi:hypothetical protein